MSPELSDTCPTSLEEAWDLPCLSGHGTAPLRRTRSSRERRGRERQTNRGRKTSAGVGWGRCWCGWWGEEVTYLNRWVQSYPARWSPYPAPAAVSHVRHRHLLTLQDGQQEKTEVRGRRVYLEEQVRSNNKENGGGQKGSEL